MLWAFFKAAILAVSTAVCKAAARAQGLATWRWIAQLTGEAPNLPLPLVNLFDAAGTKLDGYMLAPFGGSSLSEKLAMVQKVRDVLGEVLRSEGQSELIGLGGGYAPQATDQMAPLFWLSKALSQAGLAPGAMGIALKVGADKFFQDGWYELTSGGQQLSNGEVIKWYGDLSRQLPVISVQDGLSTSDWDGWSLMTRELGARVQVVGGSLIASDPQLLTRAIEAKACTAVVVDPAQLGTLSEVFKVAKLVKMAQLNLIMAGGETEDAFAAHLSVGLGAGQVQFGGLARGEQSAKYNELLRIAEQFDRM